MRQVILSSLESVDDTVEVVERKGLGHPDTICDALAEALSLSLCREYQQRFGAILHHNVDKALLCGGSAVPSFGGGTVTRPIDIYLAGRASAQLEPRSSQSARSSPTAREHGSVPTCMHWMRNGMCASTTSFGRARRTCRCFLRAVRGATWR
jgi:S-adenosylmethionine synthetase